MSDNGRGVTGDIDPNYRGYEYWSFYGIYNSQTETVGQAPTEAQLATEPDRPWPNFRVWWDGDVLSENLNETKVEKWNPATQGVSRLLSANSSAYGATDTSAQRANILRRHIWRLARGNRFRKRGPHGVARFHNNHGNQCAALHPGAESRISQRDDHQRLPAIAHGRLLLGRWHERAAKTQYFSRRGCLHSRRFELGWLGAPGQTFAQCCALTNLPDYQSQHALSNESLRTLADLNNSGTVTNSDIQALFDLLTPSEIGSGSLADDGPVAAPESTSAVESPNFHLTQQEQQSRKPALRSEAIVSQALSRQAFVVGQVLANQMFVGPHTTAVIERWPLLSAHRNLQPQKVKHLPIGPGRPKTNAPVVQLAAIDRYFAESASATKDLRFAGTILFLPKSFSSACRINISSPFQVSSVACLPRNLDRRTLPNFWSLWPHARLTWSLVDDRRRTTFDTT